MTPAARQAVVVVDAGNTTTRFGLACAGVLFATWGHATSRRLTADEATLILLDFLRALEGGVAHVDAEALERLDDVLGSPAEARAFASSPARPVDGIVSSVVPSLTDVWVEALARFCGRAPLVVGPGLKTGLKMRYSDPGEVGGDRVADMVATVRTYGSPAVVVDLGTTTNIEVLDESGAFAGGLIAPGPRLSAEMLANAAARLPLVEIKAPGAVVGRSTREAMQSGMVLGEVARVDGLIDMIWDELGYQTSIILSGRDAEVLGALMRHEVKVDQTLTLRGLVMLHEANRKAAR